MKEESSEPTDSFTIGTPSKGGALKVYFDLSDEQAAKKIEKAIEMHKKIAG